MNKLFPFLLFTLIFVGQFFTVKNYLELKYSRIKTNTIEHKKDTVKLYKTDTINHYIFIETYE